MHDLRIIRRTADKHKLRDNLQKKKISVYLKSLKVMKDKGRQYLTNWRLLETSYLNTKSNPGTEKGYKWKNW